MPLSGTSADDSAARRRAFRLLGLVLTVLSLALALPAGASAFKSAAGGWFDESWGSRLSLNAVDFSDAGHGWAVGTDGTILATTNGGVSWFDESWGGTLSLNGVAFPDASHGWAVGDSGTILATTNGGAIWSAQSSGRSVPLYGVAFPDASHGWAVGAEGVILATTNGGTTWKAQGSGSTAYLVAVEFSDATHGWAVGDFGTVLATTNGGVTWRQQGTAPFGNYRAVAFADDSRHGWAAGANGIILATTNGGGNWGRQRSGTSTDLNGIDFPGATHGWAVGDFGTILATTDGGSQTPKFIMWNRAKRHAGLTKTVKGPVKGTKYASSTTGRPTFLNIGKNYPSLSRFTVVIWGKCRSAFPSRPEVMYRGKTVLATGRIHMFKGSAQMSIRSPSKLRVVD